MDAGDAAGGNAAAEPVASTSRSQAAEDSGGDGDGSTVADRRASDTNVQVEGIDEPDLLKTTSDTLHYATEGRSPHHRSRGGTDDGTASDKGVRLIDADDPTAPGVDSRLNVSGDLLLADETLAVFDDGDVATIDAIDRVKHYVDFEEAPWN